MRLLPLSLEGPSYHLWNKKKKRKGKAPARPYKKQIEAVSDAETQVVMSKLALYAVDKISSTKKLDAKDRQKKGFFAFRMQPVVVRDR